MPDDIDKSLLDRLQALRGSSATPERQAPTEVKIDLIERAKTPSREDALAARLRSLREHGVSLPARAPARFLPRTDERHPQHTSARVETATDVLEALFQTDDQTLEELLAGDDAAEWEQPVHNMPSEGDIKAMLDNVSLSTPKWEACPKEGYWDDSDGEEMKGEVDDVMAQFRDAAEVDAALNQDHTPKEDDTQEGQPTEEASDILPSLPANLDSLPSVSTSHPASTTLDDLTTRMAALRAPTASDDILPSVPTSKPAGKPIKRLTSTTAYTDDDVDSWCVVCLEDATLRCLGCEDEPYCARCWREMHVGPAAGFDERGHRAVQFTRSRKKEDKRKVMMGAS